jgi:hypothetical protein
LTASRRPLAALTLCIRVASAAEGGESDAERKRRNRARSFLAVNHRSTGTGPDGGERRFQFYLPRQEAGRSLVVVAMEKTAVTGLKLVS